MIRDDRLWKGTGCLTYKRCSKDVQDASLEDQDSTIGAGRTRLGLTTVIAGFEDDGRRGHDETRPGLLAILEYVKKHPNPVRQNADFIPILVYDLARFGRFDDAKKIFAYFVEVERYGYEFYSVTEKIRSRGNIADFVQAIVKAEQAYDYSVKLSSYGIRTGVSLAERGWWPGGTAPYGYDRMTYGPDLKPKYIYRTLRDKSVEKRAPDGTLVETIPPIVDKGKVRSAYSDKIRTDKVKLVPGVPEYGRVVRSIFEKFVKEGWGQKRIAAWLNAQGVAAPRGRKWLHTTVKEILENPAYKGALVYGRRSDGKHHWLTIKKDGDRYLAEIERKDVPRREFVHRTEDECIVDEDCHPALVVRAIWEKAYAKIMGRKTSGRGRSGLGVKSTYLLSGDGLIRCAHCGYRFQGDTDRRNKIRRYVDAGYHMGGTSVCRCYMVLAEPLEEFVIGEIRSRILDGRAALFASREDLESAIERALVARRAAPAEDDKDVGALEKQLAERRHKIELLVANVSPENMPLLNDHLSKLRREIDVIESELRALRVAHRATSIVTRDLKTLAREAADYLVTLKDVLESGSPDQQKRLVRDFVADIVVEGEKREVRVGFYADMEGGQGKPLEGLAKLAERCAGAHDGGTATGPKGVPLWYGPRWGHQTHP